MQSDTPQTARQAKHSELWDEVMRASEINEALEQLLMEIAPPRPQDGNKIPNETVVAPCLSEVLNQAAAKLSDNRCRALDLIREIREVLL